jgi:2-isopropylmalate synthase
MDDIVIFDTTLRDGEQSPGAAMTAKDRLKIARELEGAGVTVIEAGFPAASPAIADSVAEIAQCVRESKVAALARAVPDDIDAAWRAVRHAKMPRLHTFIATSRIHMEHKLRMTPRQVLGAATEAVRRCRRYTDDVEFCRGRNAQRSAISRRGLFRCHRSGSDGDQRAGYGRLRANTRVLGTHAQAQALRAGHPRRRLIRALP